MPRRPRTRLPPDERRAQLLEAAARILARDGVDHVSVTEVADEAGVSRPVVYRFFANRQALIVGVIEAFGADLTERFARDAVRSLPGNLADVARVFMDAVCDTIVVWGDGAWHLLDAKGPDPEVAAAARAVQRRLVAPWQPHVARITGADEGEVGSLLRMVVASGFAALEGWVEGTIRREEAVAHATRGVSALLGAFTVARTG